MKLRAVSSALLGWMVAASCGVILAAEPTKKTNVLLSVADDMAGGELGCQGNPQVATPNIDGLAAAGVGFTNANVSAPQLAIHHGDWKLVKASGGAARDLTAKATTNSAQLENLSADISEQHDLATSEPTKVRELAVAWEKRNAELALPVWAPGSERRAGAQGGN